MKITAGLVGWGIAAFVWSIFMGVTAISIGVGAAYPPANFVAKPFVCPNGQMYFDQQVSNPLPGTTYTTITWYCTDPRSDSKTELDIFPMSLYAGVIYGLLLFVLVAAIWVWAKRKDLGLTGPDSSPASPRSAPARAIRRDHPEAQRPKPDGAAMARMAELKKLRAANMISEAEYEQKRAEILRDL